MSYVDVLFGNIKSHEDWGLKLETIQLSFPEAKTDQIDIPGANGVIDLTEVNGQVCYKNRTMTLTFSLDDDYAKWHLLSSRIAKELHGKMIKCILPDDPNYYYEGRFSIDSKKTNDVITDIVITGDVHPFKMDVYSSSEEWLWDPFSFEDGIIRSYHDIEISGTTPVSVIGSEMPVVPKFVCSTEMELSFKGSVFHLSAGETTDYDIILSEGENQLIFTGHGTVTIEYRGGIL